MIAQLRASLAPPTFASAEQNRTARILNTILLAAIILVAVFLIVRLATGIYTLQDTNLYVLGGLNILLIGLWFVMRRGYLRLAAAGTVIFAWLALAYVSYISGGVRDSGYIVFFVIAMIASLVLGWREAVALLALTIATGWFLAYAEAQGVILGESVGPYEVMTELTVIYLLFAILLYLLVSNLSAALAEAHQTNLELQTTSTNLEKGVAERTQELLLAAAVSQRIASLRNLDNLLDEAVTLIQESFNLYYAQVYLLDDQGEYLELRAGTGGVGQVLLEQKHRLPVMGKSVNSTAVSTRQPVIVTDTSTSDIFRPNPLLPFTRSEMSVPLMLEETVVGVLNLQSSTPNSLASANLPVFQILAGQLAVAINNANLLSQRERVAAALQEEQRQVQALLESLSVPIIISMANSGAVAYANDAMAELLQISRQTLVGQPTPNFYINPTDRQKFYHELKGHGQVVNQELLLRRKGGQPFWALISGHLINFQNQPAVLTTIIDVDERHKAQETISQRAAQLETVAQVGTAAAALLDPASLLQEVVDRTRSSFDLYHAHIYLVGEDGKNLVLAAGAGEIGRKMMSAGLQIPIEQERSLVARAARLGKGITVNDVQADPGFLPNPLLPLTRAEMAVPMLAGGMLLGVLDVQAAESGRFSENDVNIFTTLAAQVAIALQNTRQYQNTQNALAETAALLNVMQVASGSLDVESILVQVLDQVLAATGFAAGLVSLVNQNTGLLELAHHRMPEQLIKGMQKGGLKGSLCEAVFFSREAITLYDLTQNAPVDVSSIISWGFRSYQGVPIQARGETLGTICIFSNSVLAKDLARTNLLQAIGQQVGFALQTARLFTQTQKALAESQTFRRLVESSNQGVAMASLDGAITYANPAMLQFLEIEAFADLLGESITNFYPGEQRLFAETEIIFRVLDGGQWQGEMVLLSSSGREIPTLENYTLIRDEKGEPAGIALIITDISDRKEAERAQQRLAAELEERLREVSVLQRAMTHEGWRAFFTDRDRPVQGYHFYKDELRLISRDEPGSDGPGDVPGIVLADSGASPTDEAALIAPMQVRGEPIGVLGARHPEGKPIDAETQALLAAISAQVAEALERARLFEETELGRQEQSQRARREQLLREITAKVRSSADVDTVLRTAVQEIGRSLGRKAFIQLEMPPDPEKSDIKAS